MMKSILSKLTGNGFLGKIVEQISVIVSMFKTLFNHILGRGVDEDEYIYDICFKVLDNVSEKIHDLDERFAVIFKNLSSDMTLQSTDLTPNIDKEAKQDLIKLYVLCYRCLEALRIMFIYSSSNFEIKQKIEKLQQLIEIRVKFMDTNTWVSILRHDNVYGNSKTDILTSPLISMFTY